MELTVLQLAAIGVLASVITRGLQLAANRWGYNPGRVVVNIGLFVVSLVVGVAILGIPEFSGSDPQVIAEAVLAAATAIVGAASLVYNVLLNKVLLPAE